MSYCSQQDLVERYGETELVQLTDKTGSGEIDAQIVANAIADADSEIDDRLGSRYKTPIRPVTRSLVRVACDIARYYLYDDHATEHVAERYKNAVKFLDGVASGKISIGIDAAGARPESNNSAQMVSGGNVFNRRDKSFI
ncbi:MAG: phage protein Gp36 family protein [Candidatus Sedimenticola sp. 6PFRAG7]